MTKVPRALALALVAAAVASCAKKGEREDAGIAPYGMVDPPTIEAAFEGLLPHANNVRIETNEGGGAIHCTLDRQGSPHGVAIFAGLARGRATWRDPRTRSLHPANSGDATAYYYYDGLKIFRAIPDLMIQSGCPIGDGTGHPGFRIELEPHADDEVRLSKPGALFLASYHPAPNREDPTPPKPHHVIGSQFVITLGDMKHLASTVTVIGSCREEDLAIVSRIAKVVASKERTISVTHVVIE